MADLKYWIDASLVWVWKEEERGNDLQYFKIIRLSKHLEAGLGKNINRNVEELFFLKIKLLICQIARLHKVLGTHWRFIYIFNLVAQKECFSLQLHLHSEPINIVTSPLLFKRLLECFQKKRILRWLVSKSSVFGAELVGCWSQNPVLPDTSEEGAWELLLALGWSPCRLCSQWPGMPRADNKCHLSYQWALHILTRGFLPERGMVTGGEVWGHLWGWINVWC